MIARLCGYIMTIVAAGMLVAMAQSLLTLPRMKKIAALSGGAILMLTVLSPLVSLDLEKLSLDSLQIDTKVLEQMQEESTKNVNDIIKRTTEEYILDKATEVGAVISVEVTVATADAGYGYPYSATIAGVVSTAQKKTLMDCLSNELGIPEQRQVWKTI